MSLRASDVMRRSLGIIDASASLAELERAFADAQVSGFPVVQHGRIVGVVTHTDVVRRLAAKEELPRLSSFYADLASFGSGHPAESFADAAARGGKPMDELCVADLMTPSVVTVAPDATLQDVARALSEHQIHRVLVTDGRTVLRVEAGHPMMGRVTGTGCAATALTAAFAAVEGTYATAAAGALGHRRLQHRPAAPPRAPLRAAGGGAGRPGGGGRRRRALAAGGAGGLRRGRSRASRMGG